MVTGNQTSNVLNLDQGKSTIDAATPMLLRYPSGQWRDTNGSRELSNLVAPHQRGCAQETRATGVLARSPELSVAS